MKILLIRMMGFGDVASILIPAAKIERDLNPNAELHVLTYGPGVELMQLVPEVDAIINVEMSQWPDDLMEAVKSFHSIAKTVLDQQYDLVINYDTWFMPCFMARLLKDCGVNVKGNFLSISTTELLQRFETGNLSENYVKNGAEYIESTFNDIQAWFKPWFHKISVSYPEFYLNDICGYKQTIDISLTGDFLKDSDFSKSKGVIALSASGRVPNKQYPYVKQLTRDLENQGYLVWGEFDGSVDMATTLSRLSHTDLLISVPTSTQWLAHLVECPTLIIPGPLPPIVLGDVITLDKETECQYCAMNECSNGTNYSCMEVPPEKIVHAVDQFFGQIK